jgi:hypothetical protein
MGRPGASRRRAGARSHQELISDRNEEAAMAPAGWVDVHTGRRLSAAALAERVRHAHTVYEANRHIFEDERDALNALGVVPLRECDEAAAPMLHPECA